MWLEANQEGGMEREGKQDLAQLFGLGKKGLGLSIFG